MCRKLSVPHSLQGHTEMSLPCARRVPQNVTSCSGWETAVHKTSLFSHMSASFICKARHLENVRTGAEKRKRDVYTGKYMRGRREISWDATNAEIFPLKHLVCQLGTEGGSDDVKTPKARLAEYNMQYEHGRDTVCQPLRIFISPLYYMIAPWAEILYPPYGSYNNPWTSKPASVSADNRLTVKYGRLGSLAVATACCSELGF
jgi:hypothetical protein